MSESKTAPGPGQSTEEELEDVSSGAGFEDSKESGAPPTADDNLAEASVPPAGGAEAPKAGEKPKTTLEQFDDIFSRINFKKPSSALVELTKALIELSKRDKSILSYRRDELTAAIKAVDFIKNVALEEEVDSELSKYGREELDKLFLSADLTKFRAVKKDLNTLLSRINAFTSDDATSEQRSKHRQLLELSKLINTHVDKLTTGPPELPSWKKEEAALLENLLTMQTAAGSGRASLSNIRDRLAAFFSDPRKAEHFKHSHGDMLKTKALIDQLDGDPHILDASSSGLVALVNSILEPNIRQVVDAALAQAIEDRMAKITLEFSLVARAFDAGSEQNMKTLLAVLNKGIADKLYSKQVLQVLSTTVDQIKAIKKIIDGESTEDLQGRIDTATYSDLLTATTESKLSSTIQSAVVGEVRDTVKYRTASKYFDAVKASASIVDTLPLLDEYTNAFPVLGRARKVLSTVMSAFTSERSKAEFLRTGTLQDIKKMASAEMQTVNITDKWSEVLLGQFGKWADAQVESWKNELQEQKSALKNDLVDTLSRAVPMLVDAQLVGLGGILSDEQIQKAKDILIKQAVGTITAWSETANLDLIPNGAVAEDLAFIRTHPALHPDPETAGKLLRSEGLLNEENNRAFVTRAFGEKTPKLSKPLYDVIQQVGKTLFAELHTLHNAREFAEPSKDIVSRQNVVFSTSYASKRERKQGETQEQFISRKTDELRMDIMEVALARLSHPGASPTENTWVNMRKKLQQQLSLSQPVYLSSSNVDGNLYDSAREAARSYLLDMGFEPAKVDAAFTDLMMTDGKEALVSVIAGTLSDTDGQMEIFDPRFIELPVAGPSIYFKYSNNGSLNNFGSIGRSDQWTKSSAVSFTNDRFSPEQRREKITKYLQSERVHFDLLSYVSDKSHTRFKAFSEKSQLVNANKPLFVDFKIADLLSPAAMQEVIDFAATVATGESAVWNAVIEKICNSEAMKKKVAEINQFMTHQASEIAKEPKAFLEKVGLGDVVMEELLPVDWYNVLINMVIGKFDQNELRSPPSLFDQRSRLKDEHIKLINSYAATLR